MEYVAGGDIKWQDDSGQEPPQPLIHESEARVILRDVLSGVQYRKILFRGINA